MQIATITDVKPTGEPPFPSQYGDLYSFIVTFDNNTQGKANCKTPSASFRAGERVGYEVKGAFKGMNNVKITKNPDKFPGPTAEPAKWQAPAQPTQPSHMGSVAAFPGAPSFQTGTHIPAPNVESVKPVFGATVGMAMNQALAVLTRDLKHDELITRLTSPVFWYSVHEVASDVIRVAGELEQGRLAPSPTERSKSLHGQKNAPTGHPDLEALDASLPF